MSPGPCSRCVFCWRSAFLALRVGASVLLAGIAAAAAAADQSSTNEFTSELPSPWWREFNARGSVGYKDNLLLSPDARESSISFGSGADVTIARLPVDGRQFTVLVSADDTRYPNGQTVDHEDLVLALTQVKVDTSAHWRLGLDARYVYQDQVLDTSVTETNLEALLVQGHSVALLPNIRWMSAGNTWVELYGTAQRAFYRAPLDDFWEGGPRLMLGRDYGHFSAITVSYGFNLRAYDTREQLNLDQTSIPGTLLHFQQHDVELAWRHNWDTERHWRTATRFGGQLNRDNGSGFYDYHRAFVAQQLRYVANHWEVRLQGKVSFYIFPHQVATPTDLEQRYKTLWGGDLRAERILGRGFKLFASYEYEESLANRPTDQYHVNTVAGGVSFEF